MKSFLVITFSISCLVAYAIKPQREYKERPETLGLAYAEYQVTTPDNYLINVWEYKLPGSVISDKTIIMVGTDAGNMGNFVYWAKAFVLKGYRVICFDYRGFGGSSDFEINGDFLFYHQFAVDLDTVIRATRSKFPKDHVGLLSLSMGTYISLIRKEKIDFLIAEGFYHNPQAVVERIKTEKKEVVLLPPHAKNVLKITPSAPVLIFSASRDKITTIDEAREFSKKNDVSIVEFEGEHLWGFSAFSRESLGDGYIEKVSDFLKAKGI